MVISKSAIISGLLIFLIWYCLAKLGIIPSAVSKSPSHNDMSGLVRVVEIYFFLFALLAALIVFGIRLFQYLKSASFEHQYLIQVVLTILFCSIVFQIQLYFKKSEEKDRAASSIVSIENYVSTNGPDYSDIYALTENSVNQWITNKVSIFNTERKSKIWKLDPLIILNEEKTRFLATLHSIGDRDEKTVRAVSRKLCGYKVNDKWIIIPSKQPDYDLGDSKMNRKDAFTIDEFIRIRYLKYFSKHLAFNKKFSFSFFRSRDFNPIHKYEDKTIEEKMEILKKTQAELLDSSTKSIIYSHEDTYIKNRNLRREISEYRSILRRIN